MFKVKATVVAMLGDTSKYPCHFNYKIGDEIIFTGAEFKGRVCTGVMGALFPKVLALYAAGPKYLDSGYYLPFWYSPPSVYDPSSKVSDGIGFKNVLHTVEDLPYGMSMLRPKDSFKWPPHPERTVANDMSVICGDTRTSVVLMLEAFDLADDGDCIPYFRREMSILNKITSKPGINTDKIFNEFSKEEVEEIYPALSPILTNVLVKELEDIGFVEVKDGNVTTTKKGEEKLSGFKKGLSEEEISALRM